MCKINFNLYLITDRLNLPAGKNLLDQVEAGLRGGVKAVQLREKDLLFHDLLPFARQLRDLTRRYQARLIINSNLDVALTVEADGVHLPAGNPPIEMAKAILGNQALIGVSTHSLEQARKAVLDGAHYIGCGPTFPSRTKKFLSFPGPGLLREVSREISLPAFAIGGVTSDNVGDVLDAGVNRVAVSGAIVDAEDPRAEASRLRSLLAGR